MSLKLTNVQIYTVGLELLKMGDKTFQIFSHQDHLLKILQMMSIHIQVLICEHY